MSIEQLIKDPVTFLKNNKIICGDIREGTKKQSPGVIKVPEAGVYSIKLQLAGKRYAPQLDDTGTPAYLLPWKEDEIRGVRLANDAKVFFTAGLSGCKIFIQGPAKYGLVVYHANGASKGSVEAANAHMNQLFTEARKTRPTPEMVSFGRGDYGLLDVDSERKLHPGKILAGYCVNFLGVHVGHVWKFFCQAYYVSLDKETYEEQILKEHSLFKEVEYLV